MKWLIPLDLFHIGFYHLFYGKHVFPPWVWGLRFNRNIKWHIWHFSHYGDYRLLSYMQGERVMKVHLKIPSFWYSFHFVSLCSLCVITHNICFQTRSTQMTTFSTSLKYISCFNSSVHYYHEQFERFQWQYSWNYNIHRSLW